MLLDIGAPGSPRTGTDALGQDTMGGKTRTIDTDTFGRIAGESGVAVVLVDENGREVWSANNNSICRSLNPEGKFSRACARFCGRAFEKTYEAGRPVGFVCHAGLDCRAIPTKDAEKPLVAIVGRTFLRSDNYRKATERAIIGDWRDYSPGDFFENILLTGSAAILDRATRQVARSAAAAEKQASPAPEPPNREEPQPTITEPSGVEAQDAETSAAALRTERAADVSSQRSFFGSILKNDYPDAINNLLEFVSEHYGLSNLIWLEGLGEVFEHTSGLGEINKHKARLGIKPADTRLVAAFKDEMPLELREHSSERSKRVMCLFPIGVDGDVTAAIATLDEIATDEDKQHIARICHSISPQLEILRLRHQAATSQAFANAVRAFGESLKEIDTEDPWQSLTQKTAEILDAERASLLLFNDKTRSFDIKALIGSPVEPENLDEVGSRVARIVFAKKEAVLVADVQNTGLPPAPAERHYKTASFMSCPINVGNRTIGVMNFTDRVGGAIFDKDSVNMLQAIAPQLAVAIDHAALRERAGEFEQLSVTDALTGLLNRRYIEARLLEEIRRSKRDGSAMSFMMLDVDHFKSYNDAFGHPAGDEALRLVGHVIRQTLRGADVAARFGGEEFSILLPQTTADEAAVIAERIRSNLQNTDFPHRRVTASIGVASCSAELCVSSDLISAADKALYQAKNRGRNRVESFETLVATPAA